MFLSQIPLKCDAHYTVYRMPSALPVPERIPYATLEPTGASTPYKRWSKCTMEKVGGSIFAET